MAGNTSKTRFHAGQDKMLAEPELDAEVERCSGMGGFTKNS